MNAYTVNEIFYSLQGEGARAGTANVFVRFTGCNMQCDLEPGPLSPGGFACDTEFTSGRKLTAVEILAAIKEESAVCRWVILTGGEPALQVDAELVAALKAAGYSIAIETNGSIDVSDLGLDWIACSPKVAEHAVKLKRADELRYVRAHGQGIPRPAIQAECRLISPAFDGPTLNPRHLAWCIQLIKDNPEWQLSTQLHKAWLVR